MKKNNKITITIILSILLTFIFTGCFDPIYSTIRTDIKPEKPTVSGFINSITRYTTEDNKDFLVLAADGGLRFKDAENMSHGSWAVYGGLPFTLAYNDFATGSYLGNSIIKVLADNQYLYLVTIQYKPQTSIPTNPQIWAVKMASDWSTPGSEWKEITASNKITLDIEYTPRGHFLFNVFQTNDPNKDNRKVFLRKDTGDKAEYYKISGTIFDKITPSLADSGNESERGDINSAVCVNGNDYFFHSPVSITNGSKNENATHIYYASGETLYYRPVADSGNFTKGLSVGAGIASLATCNNAILFGCGSSSTRATGGIKKTSLTNGVPGESLESFTTNAVFQMTPGHIVTNLLNVTPEKDELASSIYSTVIYPGVGSTNSRESDKGLWSYYPNRANWNRE